MTKSKIPLKAGKLFILVIFLLVAQTLWFWEPTPAFAQNPDSIPFAPAVNYGAGSQPTSVFCADLDGDGDLDLAVANSFSNNVSILRNNGDATFQSAMNYGAGLSPYSVFCADLDGDGDMDLAVANYGSGDVSILKNNGDGTFQAKVDYDGGSIALSVFCADLDGDGDMDLAVLSGQQCVDILKNNGDGTFQSAVSYYVGIWATSVFCSDLDSDSDMDLAVTTLNSSVFILKNNGDGTFQTAVNYGVGYYAWSVFCADLDDDGDMDLAVANRNEFSVSILKNNGDGTFQTKVDYSVGDYPLSVFCADLDGDSDMDLAVANEGNSSVSILKNHRDGTFPTRVDYSVGNTHPQSVFCADLDGDGDLDLAGANYYSDNVSILKNLTIRLPVELWVDIVGRDQIRFGQTQTYHVSIGNFGYAEAYDVLLLISLHPDVAYNINLEHPPIDTVNWDSVATSVQIEDTLQVIPLYLAKISPDSIYQFAFTVTAPLQTNQVKYYQGSVLTVILRHAQTYHQACAMAWKELYQDVLLNHDIAVIYQEMYDDIFAQKLLEYTQQSVKYDLQDVAVDIGAGFLPFGWLFTSPLTLEDVIKLGNEWSTAASECWWRKQYFQTFVKNIHLVRSWDPNDKTGPQGFDTVSHYVAPAAIFNYVGFFENIDSATADAEDIVIVDTLDQNLDWSTLQIGAMSHPEPCSAVFDGVNGIITWTCDSIMLPPDTLPPNGEGWVSFSIKPDSGLPSGTQIKNRASIKFDYNPWMYAPMDSSYIINTIDAERPTSSVNSLPDTTLTPAFTVSWSGLDDPGGSGIAAYTVYAKTDGGPYLPWIIDTTGTSAFFDGEYGHTYYFSCTAIDNVGNREERHLTFDARTRVIGYRRGDANGDGVINVTDVVYLINYLFIGGPAPDPIQAGDVNCDGVVNVTDVVYLINYLFISGPPPCR